MGKGPRRRRASESRFHKAAVRAADVAGSRPAFGPVTVRSATAAELAAFDAACRSAGVGAGRPVGGRLPELELVAPGAGLVAPDVSGRLADVAGRPDAH